MTPYEAIRAGILEGEIPEPFWTVTTTTLSPSWTVGLLTGGQIVIDWGDGQQTWHEGPLVGVVSHTYASSGAYTVKFHSPDVSKMTRLQSNGVILTGDFPDIASAPLTYLGIRSAGAGMTGAVPSLPAANLVEFLVEANGFSGDIPTLTPHTSLVFMWTQSNNFSGYTPSVISSTCTSFNASGNALTLAAVDQILIDFTTGAGARPGAGTINLTGGTNAVPTPAVKAAAVAALPGWTITTN